MHTHEWIPIRASAERGVFEIAHLVKTIRTGIWVALLLEVLILVALTSRIGGESYFQSTFLNYSNITQVLRSVSFMAISFRDPHIVSEFSKGWAILCSYTGPRTVEEAVVEALRGDIDIIC